MVSLFSWIGRKRRRKAEIEVLYQEAVSRAEAAYSKADDRAEAIRDAMVRRAVRDGYRVDERTVVAACVCQAAVEEAEVERQEAVAEAARQRELALFDL